MKLNLTNETGATLGNGGVNYLMVLQLIFLTLKLTGLVSWSWWFVLTPLFANIALMVVIFVVLLLILKQRNKNIEE